MSATLGVAMTIGVPMADAQSGPPQYTGIRMEGKQHHRRGEAAIGGLGAKLPDVARWYGMTGRHLEHLLRSDDTLHADASGRLLYREPPFTGGPGTRGGQRAAPSRAFATSGVVARAALPEIQYDQTFKLHSRPGASRKLYLDFTGHTVSGSWWNGPEWGATISAAPFDLDGRPTTWSQEELLFIQRVWTRVLEDFAIFDVDVTTEEPTADGLARADAGDAAYGVRVVVTADFTKKTSAPCQCGGVSYLNTVGKAAGGPSWVFHDNLSSNEKAVAEAVSHEAGHALGLSHDGTTTTAYYTGHGAGVTSWAPIMGVGYGANVTQWSRGEYANANNREDDIEIIARSFPLLPDDVSNTYAQAQSLASTPAGALQNLEAAGIVGSAADVDVFTFSAGAGRITFSVTGAERGANTDLLLELRDASGNILATGKQGESLDAALTHEAANAGQYYVVVTSTAAGDGSNAFPEYGSVGRFTVWGTASAMTGGGVGSGIGSGGGGVVLKPPVAVATASARRGPAPLGLHLLSTGSTDADGTIVAWRWNFGDGSPESDEPHPVHLYVKPGNYTATLRVTDNSGLSSTASAAVQVDQPVNTPTMQVNDITLRAAKVTGTTNTRRSVSAKVTVRDLAMNFVAGATVKGSYWGDASGVVTGVTGGDGVVQLPAVRSAESSGSVSFRVLSIERDGYVYAPEKNVETVDTIRWSAF